MEHQNMLRQKFYIVNLIPKLEKGHTYVVDFYSYGALIYEMLSGAPPYYSKDKREMLKNRCEKPLELKSCFSIQA